MANPEFALLADAHNHILDYAVIKAQQRIKAPQEVEPWTRCTTLQIETDDLTELDVVRVRDGAPATVTFDALPGLSLTGKLLRVKPLGENKQGDMTYTVVIQPDRLDGRLRWNMTAAVAIEPR